MTAPVGEKQKRAVCAVGLLVSQAVDSLRQTTIKAILRQDLGRVPRGVSLSDLGEAVRAPDSPLRGMHESQLESALDELVAEGEALETMQQGKRYIQIGEAALGDVKGARLEGARRCRRVLREVLGAPTESNQLAFVQTLFLFFQSVAADYVQRLATGMRLNDHRARSALREAVQQVERSAPPIDAQALEEAVTKFFATKGKDFDYLKWNLCQSFFLIKLLRLDPGSLFVTQELLSGATILFDTNIVIDALEQERTLHANFQRLSEVADALDITLAVTPITLDEFRDWVQTQRECFEMMASQGMAGIEEKIDGALVTRYESARRENDEFTLDDLFAPLECPEERLQSELGIEILDDAAFELPADSDEVQQMAGLVGLLSEQQRHGHRKTEKAALHDARMLLGLLRHAGTENRTFLLTADKTLPNPGANTSEFGGRVIDFATTLHWIAPTARSAIGEVDFAAMFAELMRRQVLPLENLFLSGELEPLMAIERQCETLTDRDVTNLLGLLHRRAIGCDPMHQRDRNELFAQMMAVRSDPLVRLQEEVAHLRKEMLRVGAKLTASVGRIDALQNENTRLTNSLRRRRAEARARSGIFATLCVAASTVAWASLDNPSDSILEGLEAAAMFVPPEVFLGLVVTRLAVGKDKRFLGRLTRILLGIIRPDVLEPNS